MLNEKRQSDQKVDAYIKIFKLIINGEERKIK